jgi:hypothetical protein
MKRGDELKRTRKENALLRSEVRALRAERDDLNEGRYETARALRWFGDLLLAARTIADAGDRRSTGYIKK